MKQKQIIRQYLQSLYPDWIREFEIHRINTEFGFVGPRGERDIREMLADGEIEGELRGKYRWIRAKMCGCEPKKLTENTPLGFAYTQKMCKKHFEENYRPEVLAERRRTESQKPLL